MWRAEVRERDAVAACSATSVTRSATPSASEERASFDLDTKRFRLSSKRVEQAAEALLEPDLGLPPQHLARPRDIRLAHLGIVHRQRLEDDVARRARCLHDGLGELQERHLLGVADV